MAEIKISELPEISALREGDCIVVDDGTSTNRMLFRNAVGTSYMNLVEDPVSGDILTVNDSGQAVDSGSKLSDKANASHSHGNITSGGDITTNVAIASGDRLVINDESASSVKNSSITFGTSTTSFLSNKGTWETPAASIKCVEIYTNSSTTSPTFTVGPTITVDGTDVNLKSFKLLLFEGMSQYSASGKNSITGFVVPVGGVSGNVYIDTRPRAYSIASNGKMTVTVYNNTSADSAYAYVKRIYGII